ncbi:MAG: DNA-3-methyladenine glycosylase [Phycisphaerae bacterium]
MRFTLQPVAPFSLELTAWTLRRDARNEVDRWDGRTYRRVLPVGDVPVEVAVTQTAPLESPRLLVEVSAAAAVPQAKKRVAAVLDKMLGISLDLADFYRFAAGRPRLGALARRFRGVKPPRFPGVWEALVNAISCQQLSLAVGISLMNRLAGQYGLPSAGSTRAFPRPQDLAKARIADLRGMGFNHRKAGVIVGLARAVTDGRLDLEGIEILDDDSAVEFLTGLDGIGRWSAQYVLLRGLGRLNVFPADDVGFQNKLAKWLHLDEELDYEGVHRVIRRWRAYGGLIYFFMLLNHLSERGHLTAGKPTAPPETAGEP